MWAFDIAPLGLWWFRGVPFKDNIVLWYICLVQVVCRGTSVVELVASYLPHFSPPSCQHGDDDDDGHKNKDLGMVSPLWLLHDFTLSCIWVTWFTNDILGCLPCDSTSQLPRRGTTEGCNASSRATHRRRQYYNLSTTRLATTRTRTIPTQVALGATTCAPSETGLEKQGQSDGRRSILQQLQNQGYLLEYKGSLRMVSRRILCHFLSILYQGIQLHHFGY